MDLSDLLDATEPVTCQFMGKEITAHVYTAGVQRLTREHRLIWEDLHSRQESDSIVWARALLPVMIKGWDLDGEPMEMHGEPFPPTEENIRRTPDLLLNALAVPVMERWNKANPISGESPQNGSQPEATPENSQTQTISP